MMLLQALSHIDDGNVKIGTAEYKTLNLESNIRKSLKPELQYCLSKPHREMIRFLWISVMM